MATLRIRSSDVPSISTFFHLFAYLLILSLSFHCAKPWALDVNQAWAQHPLGAGGEGHRHPQTSPSKGRASGGLCQEQTEHRLEQDWLAGRQGEGPGGPTKEGLTCGHRPDSQGRAGYYRWGDKQEQRCERKHVGLSQNSRGSCCQGCGEGSGAGISGWGCRGW